MEVVQLGWRRLAEYLLARPSRFVRMKAAHYLSPIGATSFRIAHLGEF
jgi:hypothetical protein